MRFDDGMIDTLLDRTVLPGFSRIGWLVRKRGFGPLPRAEGKRIVITGASSGLGAAASIMLAEAGAELTLVSRSRERADAVIARISQLAGSEPRFIEADMADLESVRRAAEAISSAEPAIDALVLNAGVLLDSRQIVEPGIELAWATNVVGPFLLEQLLLDRLAEARGRVVMVTSGGAYSEALAMPDEDLAEGPYRGSSVYARTKRAQIALAQLQSDQFAGIGVTVHAVHPGWADTPGVETSLPAFHRLTGPLLRTPEEGADSIAWATLAPEPAQRPGLLWHDRTPRPRHRFPMKLESQAERLRLDAELRRLVGIADGPPLPG